MQEEHGYAGAVTGELESTLQDMRIALRGLRRSVSFTTITVLSLALGIGATTTMFSVINAALFRPLPWRDAGNLALIWTDDSRRGLHREPTSAATIANWKERSHSFQDVAYFVTRRVNPVKTDGSGERGRTRGATVSGNFFAVLGTTPLRGRLLSTVDQETDASVAVISHSFWRSWFGGAPDVIGRTVSLGGQSEASPPFTVIGVLPEEFYFPDRAPNWQTEIWIPAPAHPEVDDPLARSARQWTGIARLRPRISVDDARDDMKRVGRELASAYPSTPAEFPGFETTIVPATEFVAGPRVRSALWMLLGAVASVLLVVCANVANLVLARGISRQREIAVRSALGAARWRIARQLVAENLILVAFGGVIGLLISMAVTRPLSAAAAAYAPRMDEVGIDLRVLVFAVGATLTAGIACGLLPIIRLSGADANEVLREGGRGTGNAKVRRAQSALVLGECVLACVLVMGSGLFLKSLVRLRSIDPGFDAPGLLALRFEFPGERLVTEVLERTRAFPGVSNAGFIDDLFIAGQSNKRIMLEGRTTPEATPVEAGAVSPGLFETMRVALRRGRLLTHGDAPRQVVVNESFAARFFPGADPIGRRFSGDPGAASWNEIVGVVADLHRSGLERATIPEFFTSYSPGQNARGDLMVRFSGHARDVAPALRAMLVREMPGIVIVSVQTAEQGLASFSAQRDAQTWLLALFAGLALTLAAVGIFGLAHYAVAQRTREIGVRMALGATPGQVLRLLVAQEMRMPILGVALGMLTAAGFARIVVHLLYEVTATDAVTYAAAGGLLTIVALAACYLAARRAARISPVEALRPS